MSISYCLFCPAAASGASTSKPGSPGNSQTGTVLTSTSQMQISPVQPASATSTPTSSPTTLATVTSEHNVPQVSASGSSSSTKSRPSTPSGAYQATLTTYMMPTETIVMTMTATPTNGPASHPGGHNVSLAWLLPVILILGIPVLFLIAFFIFRRVCPAIYAGTDRYCPVRYTGRQLAKIPPVAAYLQRHERNKGIRARQHDYMSRRAKLGISIGASYSRKDRDAEKMLSEQKKRDDAQRDEWLRHDMLDYYAREKQSPDASAAGHGTPQRTNTVHEYTLSPSAPRSAALINNGSRTDMQEASLTSTYKCTPDKLTGECLHQHQHQHQHGAPPSGEMTLKEKIRAQREKVLRDVAADEELKRGTTEGASTMHSQQNARAGNTEKGGEDISGGWVL